MKSMLQILVNSEDGKEPCGFITSPGIIQSKEENIAMGYVPFEGA